MTSLPSQPSPEILRPCGTRTPSQPLAGNGVPLTVRPGRFTMTCSRVGLVDAALIGFAAFMAAVAIQRGTLKEIGAVSIAMDDKQIVLPGAMAQGIFRKRAESRAERIVERIKTMDPLNR